LAVDPSGILYEVQVSDKHDPKDHFGKLLKAIENTRSVLRVDPNQCNHVSDKNYKVTFVEGDKYMKNFRMQLNLGEAGPKLSGQKYIKLYSLPYGSTMRNPKLLPAVVNDIVDHELYDSAIPSDPTTWFNAEPYETTGDGSTTEDVDDDYDDYFKDLAASCDLSTKKRSAQETSNEKPIGTNSASKRTRNSTN
jgi:hypothetical protein